MWNLIAIALILVVTIATYVIAMWVTRMTNDRGDELLHGLVKGMPTSIKVNRSDFTGGSGVPRL